MRILIVTDAWLPQVNGVVRTLQRLSEALVASGEEPLFLTPASFLTVPLPSYHDIRVAIPLPGQVGRAIAAARSDHVQIATEGPLGMVARHYCLSRRLPFTTSYHTRFPEYVRMRAPIPQGWTYAWLRRFHNAGAATLVATPSLGAELTERGFQRVRPWTRGVDVGLFQPDRPRVLDLPRPIFLSVGRIAPEKNLEAFLELKLPGSKLVVGDGPSLAQLKLRHRDVVFLGAKFGGELADIYASSDVFVFPSRTDTFGIVLLEALASGLPVAAFPVTGPKDIIDDGVDGMLSESLRQAALGAMRLPRDAARAKALTFSWKRCAELFMQEVSAARGQGAPSAARVRTAQNGLSGV